MSPKFAAMLNVAEFITRCDRYCKDAGRSRVWLSKRLFDTTDRIDVLAKGNSDLMTKTLERAVAQLDQLEREFKRPSSPRRGEAA